MKQVINVTQEDINRAIKETKKSITGFSKCCPIAQAASRFFNSPVSVGGNNIDILEGDKKGTTYLFITPDSVEWLVPTSWKLLKPFKVYVEIPE